MWVIEILTQLVRHWRLRVFNAPAQLTKEIIFYLHIDSSLISQSPCSMEVCHKGPWTFFYVVDMQIMCLNLFCV